MLWIKSTVFIHGAFSMRKRGDSVEDFRIIYRILKYLCNSMDYEEFDSEGFNAAAFGTNENRFNALLIQLQESGYIKGLTIQQHIRQKPQIMPPAAPRITLKGMEYLNENGMMKKAANLAKGITDIIF